MLHPAFPLETGRLSFRPYEERDKDWFCALRRSEDLMQHIPFGGAAPEDTGEVFMKRLGMTGLDGPGDTLMCVMEEKATRTRVGEVMLRALEGYERTGELGFILHSDFHGRGYAREGALLMLRLGFESAGFHRIIAITDGANAASRGLLKRLGMREEAYFRRASYFKGAWHDDVTAAMLASEWEGEG